MASESSLALIDFVAMLKRELAEASKARNPEDAAFVVKGASVEVEVTIETDAKAEGGMKLFVAEVKGGGSRKKGVTHKLTLDLLPDKVVLLGPKATTSGLDE